jgi:hypothetical protein
MAGPGGGGAGQGRWGTLLELNQRLVTHVRCSWLQQRSPARVERPLVRHPIYMCEGNRASAFTTRTVLS